MALELGKDRPAGPASREADPRNTEQQAGLSGDNDADRIQTQPEDKEKTDEAYLKNSQQKDYQNGDSLKQAE